VSHQVTTADVPLEQDLYPVLIGPATESEKIAAVKNALEGEKGTFWRAELGKWAARTVPVELLVPEMYRDWRPLVRDAILFVVSKLSASRLAPKIVEQMSLGPDMPPEARLLRFIGRVPGLQKIGQVIARNRHLHPRLRRALIKLENGISDVPVGEVCSIINQQLHSEIERYAVKIRPRILSEASVSAVVAFTWKNPETGRREHGVFKVLKPHIPSCYAEDMKILGQLAKYVVRQCGGAGKHAGRLAETLTEVRLLLEREVDFLREQATLANSLEEYRSVRGVQIPRVIRCLSTPTITALTFEKGRKVANPLVVPPQLRWSVASRLARTLLAVPALSQRSHAIFHADPHAGNLLYDKRANQLVILDWALTETLSRKQRRGVVLLVLFMMLRDSHGMTNAIRELCQVPSDDRVQLAIIRRHVDELLDALQVTRLPGVMEGTRLLESIALDGIPFPAALLMFRKAAFTLEGVVEDVAGTKVSMDSLVANYTFANWKDTLTCLFTLLSIHDWMSLDWSAVTFASRMCARTALSPWHWLTRLSPSVDTT